MNKFKQVVESLMSDIKYITGLLVSATVYFGSFILAGCIGAAIVLKIIVYFGGVILSSGYIFIDIMLTYGIATFIIGWVGFRVYHVYIK